MSEIGFGTWQIGGNMWGPVDRDEAMRAMARAADLGVNFFDTALVYGMGKSEELVGEFVRGRSDRDKLYVATKVPPKNMQWPAAAGAVVEDVFPPAHIRSSVEKSLKSLGMERVDLLQLHVWADRWADDEAWHETMRALVVEGKIGAVGISLNSHEPESALRVVERGRVDVLQVFYNIFDQSPGDALLAACAKNDVGFIARVPFDEGGLTGRLKGDEVFPKDDYRAFYFKGPLLRETVERARALEFLVEGGEAKSLPEAALRFCLSHPAVSTVIPGMRKVPHVEENTRASDLGPLRPEALAKLKEHRWIPRRA